MGLLCEGTATPAEAEMWCGEKGAVWVYTRHQVDSATFQRGCVFSDGPWERDGGLDPAVAAVA